MSGPADRPFDLLLPPAAVLWDLDGTLADSEPLHARALAAPFAAEGLVPPADMHERVLGLSARAIHQLFQQEFGLRTAFEPWLALRWQAYLALAHTVRPRPGALPAFEALEALGCPQAVVSSSDRVIVQANLAAIGLLGRVAFTVCREDVSQPKPHPEPYLTAAARLGVAPADATVVEDSVAGALAGLAAGCRTVYWPEQPVHAAPAGALHAAHAAGLMKHLLPTAPTAAG